MAAADTQVSSSTNLYSVRVPALRPKSCKGPCIFESQGMQLPFNIFFCK